MSNSDSAGPRLIRLPFVKTERPLEIWKSCVQILDKWEKELSHEYKTQMEEFKINIVPKLIWQTNHLEGTLPEGLSESEAVHFLKSQEDPTLKSGSFQLLQHLEALNFILASLNEALTEDLIKTTHGIMMHGLTNEEGLKINAGTYRQISVCTSKHDYPEHSCIPQCMARIVESYNKKVSTPGHDPYQLASWLFFEVVSLHPFEDGNGRISRLLWCYSLMKDGLPFPAVLTSGHKKSQKHLVACIKRDRDRFYSDHPHLTTLTVVSVHQAWEQFFQSYQIKA